MSINTSSIRSWFHRNLSDADAKNLLLNYGRPGHFLIRNSSNEGDYCLVVRRAKDVIKVRIINTGDCYDICNRKDFDNFATLEELLRYYLLTEQDGLCEKNGNLIELKYPFTTDPPTSAKWYHGSLTAKEAEDLLNRCGKPGCFLVRDKSRTLGAFALSVLRSPGVPRHYVIDCKNGKYAFVASIARYHNDLDALIEFYKQNPWDEETGISVTLREPVLVETVGPLVAARPSPQASVKKENCPEQFEELQQFESQMQLTRSEGAKPENKERNRYKNILPYDDTRVILKYGDPSVPGSSYINANYVKNTAETQNVYIATQGCLSNTVADFWRMIWQENTRVIAMITKLIETGKNKCSMYWPKEESQSTVFFTYQSRLVLTLVRSTQTSPDYIIRELQLGMEQENPDISGEYIPVATKRIIYQYNYIAWPDKSVPKEPDSLLKFQCAVRDRQLAERQSGPVVVHCSAGIGRSGTFIVLGLIIDDLLRYTAGYKVDIKQTVAKLRTQRSGMVQTEAQYRFIFQILEHFQQTMPKAQAIYANIHEHKDVADQNSYENNN